MLASTSERRIRLLQGLGVAFRTADPELDESGLVANGPEATAVARAGTKAMVVAAREPEATVLAADTVVALEGVLLDKARDGGEVQGFLRRLSGSTHLVVTAVAVVAPGDQEAQVATDAAEVTFRRLVEDEIRWYAGTGEGVGKAGGYAVQGLGGMLVERLDGDIETVIGLPTALVIDLLGLGP